MLFRESLGFGTPSARPGSTTAAPARGHVPIGSVIHTYPTFTAWRPAHRLTVHRHRSRVCSLMGLLLLGSVMLVGCRDKATDQQATSTKAANQHTVRILVVDDAPLAQAIVRQWSANLDQPIRMLELPRAKLDSVQHLAADIVVYPAQALGTLAERNLIQPLQPETLNAPQLALRDVLELERHAEVQWGDQVLAVSFGSPQLVLFYRKDIFDRLKLLPPHTWTEYQTVAERLTRKSIGELAPPQQQAWTATIEPLAGQWAAKLLFARAAAYARHPSQFSTLFEYSTMEPLIDGPPFVRALEELVAASKLGPDSNKRLTPVEAKRQFLAGHAAMAFAWPSRAAAAGVDAASDASADSAPDSAAKISFAALPGALEVYNFSEQSWSSRKRDESLSIPLLAVAGRLGSVTKEAQYPHEAGQALAWLAGKKWSPLVAPTSSATTLHRKSHLEKPAIWTDPSLSAEASRDYAEVVIATQSQPDHMMCLRIPGHDLYMAALSEAVEQACTGVQKPRDALANVAQQWRKITDQLGLDKQKAAYARSLGLEL